MVLISLLGLISLIVAYSLLSVVGQKVLKNPTLVDGLANRKQLKTVEPSLLNVEGNGFKKSSFLRGDRYLTLKKNIETSSKLDTEATKNLLKHLQGLYNIEEHFKYLISKDFTDNSILKSYILNLHRLLDDEFLEHLNNLSNGYIYSSRDSDEVLTEFYNKLTMSLESFDLELEDVEKNSKVIVKAVDVNTIQEKHLKLDNVISNSLYNNSINLQQALTSDNPEIKALAEAQLEQINSFLDKEISSSGLESESQILNKLKANQKYLDSLEVNWISEDKV